MPGKAKNMVGGVGGGAGKEKLGTCEHVGVCNFYLISLWVLASGRRKL